MNAISHRRTATEQLLHASIQLAKRDKLIRAQGAYIALLRSKLGEREQFDVSADSVPVGEPRVFFRRQI